MSAVATQPIVFVIITRPVVRPKAATDRLRPNSFFKVILLARQLFMFPSYARPAPSRHAGRVSLQILWESVNYHKYGREIPMQKHTKPQI